jgi:bud site selection protein 20
MGTAPGKRRVGGDSKTKKGHKRLARGKFRTRHIDQVWEDARKPRLAVTDGKTFAPVGTLAKVELDADVPGSGAHYCIPCGRHFQSAVALSDHERTKPHRRRVKVLQGARPHNQKDAERAGGMGADDNGERRRRAKKSGDDQAAGVEHDEEEALAVVAME